MFSRHLRAAMLGAAIALMPELAARTRGSPSSTERIRAMARC